VQQTVFKNLAAATILVAMVSGKKNILHVNFMNRSLWNFVTDVVTAIQNVDLWYNHYVK